MYYSITFTDSSGNMKNTWEDWRLIPTTPPTIETPEPYTNYVEVPGRTEGPIDLSEVLSNGPTFNNSEGSWDFIMDEDCYPRPVLYQVLKDFLHGRKMKIVLEEDPLHYFMGRITIQAPQTGKGNSGITFNYSVAPVRYNFSGTAEGF